MSLHKANFPKVRTLYLKDDKEKVIEGVYSSVTFRYLANNEWKFTEFISGINVCISRERGYIIFTPKDPKAKISLDLMNYITSLHLGESSALAEILSTGDDGIYAVLTEEYPNNTLMYYKKSKILIYGLYKDGAWVSRCTLLSMTGSLGMNTTVIHREGTLREMTKDVKKRTGSKYGTGLAQGIVAMPVVPIYDSHGCPVMVSLKRDDFLGD